MPSDFRLMFCSIALAEGAALVVLSALVFWHYARSPRIAHIAGMAASFLGIVAGIIVRMWEGAMDNDPWMVLWFLLMFGVATYFVWWFYGHRPERISEA